MRRLAWLGLIALLPGCDYASSPVVSFGGFIGDTHWIERNPNRPVSASENQLRVTGRDVAVPPLETEPGNIWPGPQKPDPTLADLERQQNGAPAAPLSGAGPQTPTPTVPPLQPGAQPTAPGTPPAIPGHTQPRPSTRGSASPPTPDLAVTPPAATPGPGTPPSFAAAPRSPTILTPQGPAQVNQGGGVTTYAAPGGGVGIIVPNGNGTNTLVGPDGSVSTVPSRR